MSHLSYDDVLFGLGRDSIVLIDVRGRQERVNPGRIPGSHHVPRENENYIDYVQYTRDLVSGHRNMAK
jgi:hypothetical protein